MPTFWPTTFHLLASYSLMAASKAALCFYSVSICTLGHRSVTWTHLVFPKLGVVHILQRLWSANGSTKEPTATTHLVPVFLDASFCPLGESLMQATGQSTPWTCALHSVRVRCLPLRSRSSCGRRPAFASASAPRRGSTEYSSDSSLPLVRAPGHRRPQMQMLPAQCCCRRPRLPVRLPSDLTGC